MALASTDERDGVPSPPPDRLTRIALRTVQAGPILLLAVAVVAMTALSPYFLTERNLTNLGFQASIVAVLALGQLLVILTRGIDLSVGSRRRARRRRSAAIVAGGSGAARSPRCLSRSALRRRPRSTAACSSRGG